MPKISVILPVYNGEQYIAEAVQSILDQTFKDFELLVINDASTDNTLSVLRSFTDPRIRIVNNEVNLKVVKSLNKGLELSSGEYIARMDGDDIASPSRFQKQLAYFSQHPEIDVCATQVEVFGGQNYITRQYETHNFIKASLLFLNIIIHPSVMFKRASFIENGYYYDESYDNAEDYGLWVKTIDKLKYAIVPDVLLKYRIHDANVSVQKAANWEVLRKINFRVYTLLLNKLSIQAQKNELEYHIEIGFGNTNAQNYIGYLNWLTKLIKSNQIAGYFDNNALKSVVLHYVIQLTGKLKLKLSDYLALSKMLKNCFSVPYLFSFVRTRIIHKLKSKEKKFNETV